MAESQRWVLRRRPSSALAKDLPDLDPILAQVLWARGFKRPEQVNAFLSYAGEIGNPFDLPDALLAVERLRHAIDEREPIVVYGDFDVDGVCATVVMVSALRQLGGLVTPYIPDRFSESYGLNRPALRKLHDQGARLVVSVDCGVRSVDEVAFASSLGLDMIITDHHSVPEQLPAALAVIDAKRPDSRYAFRDLAGVGVAYRLVDALCRVDSRVSGPSQKRLEPEHYLDLVALGTIADIVPLLGENRLLAQRGLERIRKAPRPGIAALMRVADCDPAQVDDQAIGFRLGPRLNAAGRLEHASLAYDLLMSESEQDADRLAEKLDQLNQQRRRLLEEQIETAQKQLGDAPPDRLVFVADPTFHEGIVGLIASRLTDAFYLPSLVMRRGEKTTRGSARSIVGLNVTHALDACADLLIRYGGHELAAGFSLRTRDLDALRERLEGYCAKQLQPETLSRRTEVDTIVKTEQLKATTPAALASMAPFGEGNPHPALATLGLSLSHIRAVGQDGAHVRLQVADQQRRCWSAIAFRQGALVDSFTVGDTVDLVYRPQLNEWQGVTSLQLVVHAMRKSREHESS